MGGFKELTIAEKAAIEELKQRLQGEEMNSELRKDNNMYLRFLRARDFKLDSAEDMLRKHLVWRKKLKIDTILTDYVRDEVTMKYLPMSRIGFDKEGSPVRMIDFGKLDGKGLSKSSRQCDIVKTVVSLFEEDVKLMKEQSLKVGKAIEQWTYILDFEGFTLGQATHKQTIETLLALFSTYEANYPERLRKGFVVNTSIYFSMLYAIIKPLLSGATIKKVTFYGKDGWKNDLLQYIDADVLPAFLGGNRTDPDGNPLCHSFVLHGKPVPEELYMTRSLNRISSQPGSKKLQVSRKSKAYLTMKVDKANSMLEWEFETESRDIGFALFYKEKDESSVKEELIPKQRIDAHLISEAGQYKCLRPGTYILVFDNSYSWIYSKEIYCKLSVSPPNCPEITFN